MMPLVLVLAFLGAAYFLVPWAFKIVMRRRFVCAIRRSGCTCLTFDDGPHPEATNQILDLLRAAGAKATFFLIGEKVERYPELVARIQAMGHEIGEHSYHHTHAWKTGPYGSYVDLEKGRRIIGKYVSSQSPIAFRPPYGKLNLVTLLYVILRRRRLTFWDIDPKDFGSPSPESIADAVNAKMRAGSTILLHDGRSSPGSDEESTVSALRLVLESAVQRRLRLTTVSQALSRAGE